MTSLFSKLKCDLHGTYQAPLEPLFAILHLKKCKETQGQKQSQTSPHISERVVSLLFISSKSRKQGT